MNSDLSAHQQQRGELPRARDRQLSEVYLRNGQDSRSGYRCCRSHAARVRFCAAMVNAAARGARGAHWAGWGGHKQGAGGKGGGLCAVQPGRGVNNDLSAHQQQRGEFPRARDRQLSEVNIIILGTARPVRAGPRWRNNHRSWFSRAAPRAPSAAPALREAAATQSIAASRVRRRSSQPGCRLRDQFESGRARASPGRRPATRRATGGCPSYAACVCRSACRTRAAAVRQRQPPQERGTQSGRRAKVE